MAINTLVMGFGGTGTHVLTYLKELAIYKNSSRPPHLAFIEFDTIERALWQPGKTVDVAGGAGAQETIAVGRGEERIALDPDTEYLPLEEGRPGLRDLVQGSMSAAGDRDRFPHLKDWLHTDWLSKIIPSAGLNISNGAAQQRQIGRYAMFANIERIVNQVTKALGDLSAANRGSAADTVNVWIIGSSAGGTGAGCIIDAASIVRMVAANLRLRATVVGLIVLPDVYGEATGVSRSRAYSFFRELERFQEIGVPTADRYMTGGEPPTASFETTYDADGRRRAIMPARLFDYLVYLGERCSNNEERTSFFNSVANAVDNFLDVQVGPKMMEELVNLDGNPLCFGGARLTLPLNTYAELFAWEQVRDYLAAIGAPSVERDGFVAGCASGSPRDRSDAARDRAENLLELFRNLRELSERERDRLPEYVDRQLEPRTVVQRWYQFGVLELAGRDVTADEIAHVLPLTWCDPFRNLAGDDESPPEENEVKTFREMKKSGGSNESQAESRDRFVAELKRTIDVYTDARGGERSFERGRALVRRIIDRILRDRIDRSIAAEFETFTQIGVDPAAPDAGTPATRLVAELQILASIEGPFGVVEDTLVKCVNHLDAQQARRRQALTDALEALESVRPSLFGGLSVWVETHQQTARDECMHYVRWHQTRSLLADMRGVVADVRARCAAWAEAGQTVFAALVLPRGGTPPLFASIEKAQITRLKDRLHRLAGDDRALISLTARDAQRRDRKDVEMGGFAAELRRRATYEEGESLARAAALRSRWQARIGSDGRPTVALAFEKHGVSTPVADVARVGDRLYGEFRASIDARLADVDVFDYIMFEQRTNDLGAKDVAARLHQAADLLMTGVEGDGCRWVFAAPQGVDKRNFVEALQGNLQNISGVPPIGNPIGNHSDKLTLTLLKAARLEHGRIADVERCRAEYEDVLHEEFGKGLDAELQRALIYHPFRGEAEAWYIERLHARRTHQRFSTAESIPPRIVRLLDRPDFFQAFTHALATGAIRQDQASRKWGWTAPGRGPQPVDLGDGDLVGAAVVFTVQRREAGRSARFPITVAAAMESARLAAEDQALQTARGFAGCGYAAIIEAFLDEAHLDAFLEQAVPLSDHAAGNTAGEAAHRRLLNGWRLALRFYGRAGARADLAARTL